VGQSGVSGRLLPNRAVGTCLTYNRDVTNSNGLRDGVRNDTVNATAGMSAALISLLAELPSEDGGPATSSQNRKASGFKQVGVKE
jgi:hypothetical protein